MPDYDFHTLSPIDFENLVRDLLQSELSIRLESFKIGKDDGIDLRYSREENGTLIVQAKHFVNTGFKGLLSHLKNDEKAKVDRLKPRRYLLVTSVPLSPRNKAEIDDVLSPHIKDTGDIYGKDDLNNLLGMFPNVEKQHFKLWLSSTTILEEILHARIINQTRITLQDIRDKARIYVVNESFKKASEILKKYNYVLIAGIPGIGKTTLAKMLVLRFLHAEYDFIDVSFDISEAYTIPEYNRPRVYLYDDFLGRTSLSEKLRKNEDNRLLNFISAIRGARSAKLILTTREYILRQAQATYEVLNNPIFENPQCVIDLSQYTRPIRAQILYNHLYFSGLTEEYVTEIVQQRAYLKIIDHPNYNPRVVEYMTDPMWVAPHQPKEYPSFFMQNLKEPFLIWEQAFNNHLSEKAREMLLVLTTLPREVFLEDLRSAVSSFWDLKHRAISENEFSRAVSELQGNFLKITRDRENDVVAFHNPSIQDFMESHLRKNPQLYGILAESSSFFEQIQWICQETFEKAIVLSISDVLSKAYQRTLSAKPCRIINYSEGKEKPTYKGREWLRVGRRLGSLASLIAKKECLFLKNVYLENADVVLEEIDHKNVSNEDLLYLVDNVIAIEFISEKYKRGLLEAAKESFFNNAHWISDISHIKDFLNSYPDMHGEEDSVRIVEAINDVVDNLLDDDDPQFLGDELYSLEKLEEECQFGIKDQIDSLREHISIAEENAEAEEDYDYNGSYKGLSGSSHSISNEALADMFSTLLKP